MGLPIISNSEKKVSYDKVKDRHFGTILHLFLQTFPLSEVKRTNINLSVVLLWDAKHSFLKKDMQEGITVTISCSILDDKL